MTESVFAQINQLEKRHQEIGTIVSDLLHEKITLEKNIMALRKQLQPTCKHLCRGPVYQQRISSNKVCDACICLVCNKVICYYETTKFTGTSLTTSVNYT